MAATEDVQRQLLMVDVINELKETLTSQPTLEKKAIEDINKTHKLEEVPQWQRAKRKPKTPSESLFSSSGITIICFFLGGGLAEGVLGLRFARCLTEGLHEPRRQKPNLPTVFQSGFKATWSCTLIMIS